MSYAPIPLPHRIKIEKNEVLKVVHDYYAHMCKRHSVRNFSKDSVSSEILQKIIETAGTVSYTHLTLPTKRIV